jgi:hypothetical protein
MKSTRTRWCEASAVLALLPATACGPVPPGPENRCQGTQERIEFSSTSITAGLDSALQRLGSGHFAYQSIASVKAGFDSLQRDFAQQAYQLCEDSAAGVLPAPEYNRRRECQDQALLAMRALQLTVSRPDADPGTMAVSLRAGMDRLLDIIECRPKAAVAPEPTVALTAFLICQSRAADGSFMPVADCNATALKAGDRAKVAFEVNRPAFVYLFGNNATGQFQTLFPDPGADNQVTPGARRFLPPGAAWLEADGVTGVTEVLKLVATSDRRADLEALRGVNDAPTAARQLNVLTEAFTTRGWNVVDGAPVEVPVEGVAVAPRAVPVASESAGLAAVELRVLHH